MHGFHKTETADPWNTYLAELEASSPAPPFGDIISIWFWTGHGTHIPHQEAGTVSNNMGSRCQ